MFKKDFWVTFALAFGLTWLISTIFFPHTPSPTTAQTNSGGLILSTSKAAYSHTEAVVLSFKSASGSLVIAPTYPCPRLPFDIYRGTEKVNASTKYACKNDSVTIDDKAASLSLAPWAPELSVPGEYTVKVPVENTTYETHFKINEEGWFGTIWNTLFNKPIYNLLMFLTTILWNDLGWAIIVLTLIIKLLLLFPTQHAMESQRAMQLVQPKLKEIQEKYKDNPTKVREETVAIMARHKVNPLGSCLPLLVQIPVLFALYAAVVNGLNLAYASNLYPPLAALNIEHINHMFLGFLNLAKPEFYVLPVTVGILQFFQMRMTMKKNEKAKKKTIIEQTDSKMTVKEQSDMPDMSMMTTYMTYFMPFLMVIVTISVPAGVAIYLLLSSLFGIGQQYYVNREKITV